MSTNKQALREAAEKAILEEGETWWNEEQLASDYGLALHKADAKFIASANPAAVLALLDELEAAERQNGYLREQHDEWERKAISNFEECSEMAKRIEELDSQRQMAFMASNRWAEKFREAEQRNAEQAAIIAKQEKWINDVEATMISATDRAEAAERRIAELEARPANPINFKENVDADYCRGWAWNEVKKELASEAWTVGDNCTFYGFFCWGWDSRRQFNEQRAAGITVKGE